MRTRALPEGPYEFHQIFGNIMELLASLVAQMVKILPAMPETRVRSLGQEDLLEKQATPLEWQMATHSIIFAWRLPWTEEHCRLQSMESQRVRHN